MLSKLRQFKKHHQLFFSLVFAAGIISFWRGIWGLSDVFLFPDNAVEGYIASILLGIFVIIFMYYVIDKSVEDRI